jgi:hypothetical protein
MLQNRIYLGEIMHKDQSYPAEHSAIIEASLWKDVQQRLEDNRTEHADGARAADPSLLAGLLHDERSIGASSAAHSASPDVLKHRGVRHTEIRLLSVIS